MCPGISHESTEGDPWEGVLVIAVTGFTVAVAKRNNVVDLKKRSAAAGHAGRVVSDSRCSVPLGSLP